LARSIAFYGKGGIGKSTITANISAALAEKGYKVLQIGCDPKHDSTKLLLGGFSQPTVMEQMGKGGDDFLERVLYTGYKGVKCIECGGPEPGVGCAGRGVIHMMDMLKTNRLDLKQFDFILFDVLGDVVCGGFAVPMRDEYANEIFIITSGELASLFAANNIARGVKRFSNLRSKLAGVIGNERGTRNERALISTFAREINTEMVAIVPRSEIFQQAELNLKTVMDFAPESDIADIFRRLADLIIERKEASVPTPMEDEKLEDFVSEFLYGTRPVRRASSGQVQTKAAGCGGSPSPSVADERPPLFSCALAGAYNVVAQINDAVALMHSPRGCAFTTLCTNMGTASASDRGAMIPNLLCTNMREVDVVFGGERRMGEAIEDIHSRISPSAITMITSCPSAIIGDDIASVIARSAQKGIDVVQVPSDGVMAGDFNEGMLGAYMAIAEHFIDESVKPVDLLVNLIGEPNLSTSVDRNFEAMDRIFRALGLKVNCRFIRNTTVERIRNLKAASLNIPAFTDPSTLKISNFLRDRYGMRTLDAPPPVGFQQTREFVQALASVFDKQAEAEGLITAAEARYRARSSKLAAQLAGKRVMISSPTHNIDWLISTLLDLEVDLVKVCLYDLFYMREAYVSRFEHDVRIEHGATWEGSERDIAEVRPDLLLTIMEPKAPIEGIHYDLFPLNPVYGFCGALDHAQRWASNLRVPFKEGWRNDRDLFARPA
jgi:nitrogenase iron protein